jgi:hypothetical protein
MRLVSAALIVLVLTCSALSAQSVRRPDEPPVCLGFSFGQWTPALDWHAAGHVNAIDPRIQVHAADGRDWATTVEVGDEHTIMLLPSWWPAGVEVTLPNRSPALGDTVVGSAIAFVGDGRRTTPRAPVKAWAVSCSRSPSDHSAPARSSLPAPH